MNAEKFVDYLEARWRAFVENEGNVPCGDCRGCCRAGYAIGLSEKEAAVIPHSRIEGYAVILPMPDGACPYLVDEKCAIYEQRPVSCRQFDCRDFTLASLRINVDKGGQENQRFGVTEINASVERFHAENKGLASTMMSTTAEAMVTQKNVNAIAAGQHAMMMALLAYLPKQRGEQLIRLLCGLDETTRGKAMEAVDKMLAAKRGKPA